MINNCENCGNEYEVTRKGKRFCSDACQRSYHRKTYNRPKNYSYTCKNCGKEYKTAHKERDSFCSRDCSYADRERTCICGASLRGTFLERCQQCNDIYTQITIGYYLECSVCQTEFEARYSFELYCSECRDEKNRIRSSEYLERIHNESNKVYECKQCGDAFSPRYGSKRRAFCSGACADKYKLAARGNVARAVQAGVEYEVFDEVDMLAACGWVCYLCGERTPKELRGTYEDNAPEVEHIVPISAGGTHTLNNTACACRKCNSQKRDKSLLLYLAMTNG